MPALNLDENSKQSLLDLPKTGMGFQLVEATVWGLLAQGARTSDEKQIRAEQTLDIEALKEVVAKWTPFGCATRRGC